MALTFAQADIGSAGNTIEIALNAGTLPVSSDSGALTAVGFTLTVDGSSVSLGVWGFSAATILIALPTTINSGQVCTLSYDGTGGVKDGAASSLATFSNQAVTNISTVEALSTYALTTLAKLKLFLRITDTTDNTLLTQIINQTSALIETVTGHKFLARDYRERYNGKYQRNMVLKQYPVQTITRVAYGWANAMHLSYSGSAIRATAAIYQPDPLEASGGLRLVTISSTGTKTANNLSFASNGSVSALVTAVNAVSGWSATADVNVPSRDLNPIAMGDALGRTVWLTYPDQDDVSYTVDGESGIIQFSEADETWFYGRYRTRPLERRFPWGFQGFLIEYNAGYSTVPEDVVLVCHEIAAEKFYVGQDNPAIKSESLGPYSVTFSSDDFSMIRSRLSHYIDGRAMIGG